MTHCCDYGCDQSPHCPARIEECHVACSAPPRRRQGFAPGTIEGPYRRRRHWITSERAAQMGKAALILAFLASLSVTLGFAAGYFNLLGWSQ